MATPVERNFDPVRLNLGREDADATAPEWGNGESRDPVEEASIESFPASDPPAFNLGEEGRPRRGSEGSSREQGSDEAAGSDSVADI